jgi:hypothetical protein
MDQLDWKENGQGGGEEAEWDRWEGNGRERGLNVHLETEFSDKDKGHDW